MSDRSQTPGSRQVNEGESYPPEMPNESPLQESSSQQVKKIYLRSWFWVVIVLALLLAVGIAVISGGTSANNATPNHHMVVYKVTGSTLAYIDWDVWRGYPSDIGVGDQSLPWTVTVNGPAQFKVYDVTANLVTSGVISCTLIVDGQEIASETGKGYAATVDCAASYVNGKLQRNPG